MITDDQVLELFGQADPARRTEVDDPLDATGYLTALRTRSIDVTDSPSPTTSTHSAARGRLLVGVAAAAVLVAIGLIMVIDRRDDGGEVIPAGRTTTPDEATIPAAETLPPPTDPAVQPAIDYLATYALGDPERVAALHADDFTLRFAYSDGGLITPDDESFLSAVHQAAAAVEYADPDCVIGEVGAIETEVSCTARLRLPQHQAANSDGVPVDVVIVLAPDGVRRFDTFHEEGFVSYVQAFDEWALRNCPTALDDPATAAERIERGTVEARCAAEWSDFAVQVAADTFSDLAAGDVDAFLAEFADDTPVLGVAADEAPATFAGLVASGAELDVSNCATDGVLSLALQVVCDATLVGADGSEDVGTVSVAVTADGVIASNTTTVNVTGS